MPLTPELQDAPCQMQVGFHYTNLSKNQVTIILLFNKMGCEDVLCVAFSATSITSIAKACVHTFGHIRY